MNHLRELTEKVKNNYQVNKNEALELLNYSYEQLREYADEIRQYFCGNNFDICTIINGKSGKCSEDCKYCAQSAHYTTNASYYELLPEHEIIKDALSNLEQGVKRYSVVTSGKRLSQQDFQQLLKTFDRLNNETDIKLCTSLGLLGKEDFKQLRDAGVVRYHNNLETSENFFKEICTTHTYQDKLASIKAAQAEGLEVCCGGIIGLGESNEDRIDLAFAIKELKITSIPLNMLNPIAGTPLENIELVSEEEFLKIAAVFRFINPQATIRLAGGRNLLTNHGELAFKSGVNGTISGNLLTTYGNSTDKDIKLITSLGYEVE